MRRRLVLAIAGVAAVAVVLFAVPLALSLRQTSRNEELLRLQRDTVAATRSIDVTRTGDPIELPSTGAQLAVYDRAARRIAGRGGPATGDAVVRDALRSEAPTGLVRDGRLLVAVPVVVGERVTGIVRAERNDGEANADLVSRLPLLTGAALAVVLLATLAALLLARRLAAPLERLAGSARRLGEGDFSVRASRTGISEVDDVAAALDAAAGRLDALVSRERAFSADASHQLRTPLAALQLELDALELRGPASPELDAAQAQAERLQQTVTTLLAAARDAPRTPGETDLGELLARAEPRWRPRLAEAGRPLRLWLPRGAARLQAPPTVVQEILEVLVENAIGHGRGAVGLTGRADDGAWVTVDVADEGDGRGLDPELIFERRSEGARGTGIGLALARSLAHAEGARLTLRTTTPPTFTLRAPAVAAARTTAIS